MLKRVARSVLTVYGKASTSVRLRINRKRMNRRLDIGPGTVRIQGFETMNIVWSRTTDYILDASRRLPFRDNTFCLIHASHVLEHIAWYRVEQVLQEWVRILMPGGALEIWVPDAYKVCKVVIDAERGLANDIPDDWSPHNPHRSPYLWANGRLFWGANPAYPSWHMAMFTPKYLHGLLEEAGLAQVGELGPAKVRGYDHGWINLGMTGVKP